MQTPIRNDRVQRTGCRGSEVSTARWLPDRLARIRWSAVASAGFWIAFLATAGNLVLQPDPGTRLGQLPIGARILLSPLTLAVLWFGLLHWRRHLQRWIERLPLAGPLRFLLTGVPVGAILVQFTVAFGLSPDLDPRPVVNTLLYVGPWGGLILGWYLLRSRYAFDHRLPFWIGGLVGAVEEQGFMVPMAALSGDLVAAVLGAVFLIPCYGIPIAAIWVIAPDRDIPGGTGRLGWLGRVLCVVVPKVLFFALAWPSYWLLGVALGTDFLGR